MIVIEKKSDFEKLVDKEKHQVFFFDCVLPLPLNFSRHVWIVTNSKGNMKRYEGSYIRNKVEELGYLYMNEKKFSESHNKYFWKSKPCWKKSKINKIVKGDLAKKIINIVENSIENYPYKNKYSFYPGPNSNTYIQWIVDKCPELELKLPQNAFGKNYRR